VKKQFCAAVAAIALAMSAAPAFAQQTASDTDTVPVWARLEETLAEQLGDYGSDVEVVTGEQIRNGGFNDTSQALQMLVPGLYVAPKNGPFDYINASLLGGRRTDIIWLIDGVRISNRLYTSTTPLDTIPASMIERIEVLKGGQSLFYGTSATSGAINIITKGFTPDLQGQFSIGADTQEGRHISGTVSDGVGNHRFVAYASHDEADGQQPFFSADTEASATDRNRGYDVTTFGLKYGYEFSDDVRTSITYQHTDATVDFAGPSAIHTSFNDRVEDILSAKLDWSVGDRFDFFAKAYGHWWTTHFTEIDNTIPVSGSLDIVDDNEFWGYEDYGINLMGQYALTDSIDILGGVDHQNYNGEDQVFLIAHRTEYVTAPFAQIRWRAPVLQGLNIAAGVRHNIPKGDGESTVWNVSADLAITDYLGVRGMVGTSFRLPDAYELYVVDPCCEQGNPNLKAEESMNYEIGLVGQMMDRFRWEITAFRREIDDRIQIITLPSGIDSFDNNASQIETNGAEFTVSADLGSGFTGTIDWTHTETEVENGTTQVADLPEDTAKLNIDWSPDDVPFGAGVSVAYVGDVANSSGTQYGGYTVVDLNGRWYLDADRRQHIGVRIENLTDEEYVTGFVTGQRDATGANFRARARGMERTLHVSYGIDF
jgi:vitamin B12 transporter